MKPYPLELRQRIVAAVEQREQTIEEIAEMFGVTERYVYKLLQLYRQTGDLSPRPPGGGAVAKLNQARLLKLAELIADRPDATLEELRQSLNSRRRETVSLSTVWRGLQQIDFTVKKKRSAPVKLAQKNARPSAKNR